MVKTVSNARDAWNPNLFLTNCPLHHLSLVGTLQASMTVADIPDLQRGGGDLGSVVFSECFLESSINIQQKGADSPELYPPMIYQTTGLPSPIHIEPVTHQ